jgi:hypothetical protein
MPRTYYELSVSLGSLAWHFVDKKSPYCCQQRKYLEILQLLENYHAGLQEHVSRWCDSFNVCIQKILSLTNVILHIPWEKVNPARSVSHEYQTFGTPTKSNLYFSVPDLFILVTFKVQNLISVFQLPTSFRRICPSSRLCEAFRNILGF